MTGPFVFAELRPDELSPREALEMLYKIKGLSKGDN